MFTKEHFGAARSLIMDKIDALTEKFDSETEKELLKICQIIFLYHRVLYSNFDFLQNRIFY